MQDLQRWHEGCKPPCEMLLTLEGSSLSRWIITDTPLGQSIDQVLWQRRVKNHVLAGHGVRKSQPVGMQALSGQTHSRRAAVSRV